MILDFTSLLKIKADITCFIKFNQQAIVLFVYLSIIFNKILLRLEVN